MATATYIETDTTTLGDWRRVPQPASTNQTAKWGTEGVLLVDANGTYTTSVLPSHISMSTTGSPLQYTWNPSSSDNTRGIQAWNYNSTYFAAAWYKTGTFGLLLTITDDRTHIIRVCCFDYDANNRNQTIRIRDGSGGTVLDTRALTGGSFNSMIWVSWLVTGTVEVEVTYDGAGNNAVVSAIVIDCPIARTGMFF